MAQHGGGPKEKYTKEIRLIFDELLNLYLEQDPLFFDEDFGEMSRVIPYFDHFCDLIKKNWKQIQSKYVKLKQFSKPPSSREVLRWDELCQTRALLNQRQKVGLIYGALGEQVNVSMAQLLLNTHGIIKKNDVSLGNQDDKPLKITMETVKPLTPIKIDMDSDATED